MENKLKVLRAMHDWSQTDLADRLGVSRQTISSIEKGKYDPSLILAFKLSILLKTVTYTHVQLYEYFVYDIYHS